MTESAPVRLYTAAQVRELDRIAIEEHGIAGLTLMKRAAEACVEKLISTWPGAVNILVLCGSGNNAGDGFIVAGLLAAKGKSVQVGLVGNVPGTDTDAGQAYHFCVDSKVDIATEGFESLIAGRDLIVDALLGTGLSGEVRPGYAQVIRQVNESGVPVLSVDLPSGLCADTGRNLGECVDAAVTVTFIGRKFGLYTNNGPGYAGEVTFAPLDVPESIFDRIDTTVESLSFGRVIQQLPPRHSNAHKMSHGHLLVIGGDAGMGGAVSMAAEAAIYSGAGMVSVATRETNVAAIISRRPEVMARGVESPEAIKPLLARANAIVLGPGLGQGSWGEGLFDAIMQTDVPMLLDADGLNWLAKKESARGNWVLTPHPGEAGRLLPGRAVQEDRRGAVLALQAKHGGVVLLKGAGTLIADESKSVSLCPYGNPGMAVAGMGDVLSGVIGSLLAQGLGLCDAAKLGAVVHSHAADRIAERQGTRGLLATELLEEIRKLFNEKA